MNKKTINIILIMILVLGSFLRVYRIDSESFWIDEAATAYTTQQKPFEIVVDIYKTLEHAPQYNNKELGNGGGGIPPFYLLVANYWTKLFGLSEFKLRLLSALFGVLSIYMIFLVGKILFDYRIGLISAFVLSINYIHIHYSQEARSYSLLVFLTLMTAYFLLNALKTNKKYNWFVYIISSIMLIYTHYFGFFMLFFEYLFLIIYFKKYKKYLNWIILSVGCTFIFYIPWIDVLYRLVKGSEYLSLYLGKSIIWDAIKIFLQFNSWIAPDFASRVALRGIYHSLRSE